MARDIEHEHEYAEDEAVMEHVARTQRSIREELDCFRDHYWPVYEPYGFTFPQAFQAWLMSTEIPEPREPWQE